MSNEILRNDVDERGKRVGYALIYTRKGGKARYHKIYSVAPKNHHLRIVRDPSDRRLRTDKLSSLVYI